MKIAIVRLSSLGDIIFCMASLQIIKHHLPESSITWFADKKFADILDYNPDLDGIVKLDLKGLKRGFSLGKLRDEYRQITAAGRFDLVIDLHGMIKSAFIAGMIDGSTAGFHKSMIKEPLAALFYQRVFTLAGQLNPVCRYTSLAMAALGLTFDESGLIEKRSYLFSRPEDEEISRTFFRSDRKNVILVAGTSAAEKEYPKEGFVAIANGLGQNVLICHGNDKEAAVAHHIAEHSPYVSVLPRMNLNQLKAAISRADLVIGGDTGPTHIAWANNVPSIALFGPTPPCTYVTKVNRVVTAPSSPSSGKGASDRPFIRQIDEQTILKIAEELLQ